MNKQPSKKTFKNPAVVINSAAGSTSDISAELKELFANHNLPEPRVLYVDPDKIEESIDTVVKEGADVLLTYGGDGTARTGALAAAEAGIFFVPLPGGTMNMLIKAIYGTDEWQEVIEKALVQGSPAWLPAGDVNGHPFFVGAIIGQPARFAVAREEIRDANYLDAAREAIDVVKSLNSEDEMQYRFSRAKKNRSANLIVVTCPFMNESADSISDLELAAISTQSSLDFAAVGLNALISDWRNSKNTFVKKTKLISLKTNDELDALVDGESMDLSGPVVITLNRKAIKVLAPNGSRYS